jgi:hypothetical protein
MQLLNLLVDVTLACTGPTSRPLDIHTILAQQAVHILVVIQAASCRSLPTRQRC